MRDFIQPYHIILAALLFSLTLLAGAYGAEYLGGIKPCKLCLFQRYCHFLIIGMALTTLLLNRAGLYLKAVFAIGTAYLGTSALAFYQVLVEKKVIALPKMCHAALPAYGSFSQFKEKLMTTPHASCDQVPWSLFGISLAGYSAMFTFLAALMVLWLGFMLITHNRMQHES
jgi:disulfide bond formation protein DsbB